MRTLLVALPLLSLATGCSKTTSPGTPANVVFDSTTVDTVAFTEFQAFAVHNAGSASAYHVRVFWTVRDTVARDSTPGNAATSPPDLGRAQAGHARGAGWGNPNWIYPTKPDSIRWSAAP